MFFLRKLFVLVLALLLDFSWRFEDDDSVPAEQLCTTIGRSLTFSRRFFPSARNAAFRLLKCWQAGRVGEDKNVSRSSPLLHPEGRVPSAPAAPLREMSRLVVSAS